MAEIMSYPDNWDQIRKSVYARDNHTCQRCGATNTELHAHHLLPKSRGGPDIPENLATVCKDCHEDIHGRPIGGDSQKFDMEDITIMSGVIAAAIVLSIAIPPFAIIGIPFAILAGIALALGVMQ